MRSLSRFWRWLDRRVRTLTEGERVLLLLSLLLLLSIWTAFALSVAVWTKLAHHL